MARPREAAPISVEGSRRLPRPVPFAAAVAIAVLSALFVGLFVDEYTVISPIDELQHIDYLSSISDLDLVRAGEKVGQEAMRAEACRGLGFPYELPPCEQGATYDPSDFQEGGFNTADLHPPTYYAATALVAAALDPVADDLVEAGRWAGAAWLASGLIVFWLVGYRLGLHPIALWAVVLLLVSNPTVLYFSSTVNPDASALLAGGFVLTSLFAWERGSSLWLLGMAAVLAVSLKATHVVALGAAGVYLLGRPRLRGWDRWRPVLAIVLAAAIAVLGWMAIWNALRVGPGVDPEQRAAATQFSAESVVSQSTALLTPLDHPPLPPEVASGAQRPIIELFSLALIASTLAAIVGLWRRRDRLWLISVAGGVSMVLGGVALYLANYAVTGVSFNIQPRYGMPLLPFLGLSLAWAATVPVARYSLAVLASASAIVTLVAIVN